MGVYDKFFRKRNSSGMRKPTDPVVLLEAVAEIRENGGSIVDLSQKLNDRDDNEAVRKTLAWVNEASEEYPEFATALSLPIPADRENALMPGKQGRQKKVLSAAQRAAMLERYGLKTK